jgi:hypothetical protein
MRMLGSLSHLLKHNFGTPWELQLNPLRLMTLTL